MTDKDSPADDAVEDRRDDARIDSLVVPELPLQGTVPQNGITLPTISVDATRRTDPSLLFVPTSLATSLAESMPRIDYSGVVAGLGGVSTGLAAAVAAWNPGIDYSSSIPGLSGVSMGLAEVIAESMPRIDYSGVVAGLGGVTTGLAAAVAAWNPGIDYSSLIPGFSGVSTGLAAALGESLPRIGYSGLVPGTSSISTSLAAAMANVSNARLLSLERGFLTGSGTATDFFGELDAVVKADKQLYGHLRRAVAATQQGGSFGLDYKSVQVEAAELADRLDGDPELERHVRSTLEPVQELTGLTDERLIDFGEMLGWWKRVAPHKVSAAGIILGFTVGLVSYIAGEGSGIASAPSAAVEAIILGGGIYGIIHRKENS
jgi:hypothetical protein